MGFSRSGDLTVSGAGVLERRVRGEVSVLALDPDSEIGERALST